MQNNQEYHSQTPNLDFVETFEGSAYVATSFIAENRNEQLNHLELNSNELELTENTGLFNEDLGDSHSIIFPDIDFEIQTLQQPLNDIGTNVQFNNSEYLQQELRSTKSPECLNNDLNASHSGFSSNHFDHQTHQKPVMMSVETAEDSANTANCFLPDTSSFVHLLQEFINSPGILNDIKQVSDQRHLQPVNKSIGASTSLDGETSENTEVQRLLRRFLVEYFESKRPFVLTDIDQSFIKLLEPKTSSAASNLVDNTCNNHKNIEQTYQCLQSDVESNSGSNYGLSIVLTKRRDEKDFTYSEKLNKLFLKRDKDLTFCCEINEKTIHKAFFLRIKQVFSQYKDGNETVNICDKHSKEIQNLKDSCNNSKHIIHCDTKNTKYIEVDLNEFGKLKHEILVPIKNIDMKVPIRIKFKCFNSCASLTVQKHQSLLFQLEEENKKVVGYSRLDLNVSKDPFRSKINEEVKIEKQETKFVEKLNKRKIEKTEDEVLKEKMKIKKTSSITFDLPCESLKISMLESAINLLSGKLQLDSSLDYGNYIAKLVAQHKELKSNQ